VLFAPAQSLGVRDDIDLSTLGPVPIGVGRVHREGTDVTVVAVGHLVQAALSVADALSDQISVEVFDPRTLHPFDWDGLAASVAKTRRLVVVDDSNRACGIGGEIIATMSERVRMVAPPRRITRPDGAVLPFALGLDLALQPTEEQLADAVREVAKAAD
jgi:pyruvate/2-oxoglutarate/acetoin dehydrogenase E1 component